MHKTYLLIKKKKDFRLEVIPVIASFNTANDNRLQPCKPLKGWLGGWTNSWEKTPVFCIVSTSSPKMPLKVRKGLCCQKKKNTYGINAGIWHAWRWRLIKDLQQTMYWSSWMLLCGVLELWGKVALLFNAIFDWHHIGTCWRTEGKGTFNCPNNTSFLMYT